MEGVGKVKEAMLYEKLEDGRVRCGVCPHHCVIAQGKRGICAVRENREGTLYALNYGKAIAVAIDPVEKKPLNHFLPGTTVYSFATIGCNLRCLWCQNWAISQASKPDHPIYGEDISPVELLDDQTKYFINATGRFVIGGPAGDSGWTGKKIIVDTYGGFARHGGGSFSGKDPTKVDRSAAYAARYVAKNIVAAGLAGRCEIQLAYVIGVARPVSVRVETFGTASIAEERIEELVEKHFDLRPAAIICDFNLWKPIYKKLACYGHFGRPELDLPWERTAKAALLAEEAMDLKRLSKRHGDEGLEQ